MRAAIAVTLICGITAVIIIGLYQLKDSHIGFTNVCMEWLHPDTCGRSATESKE
jgi:hypothetical protein